MEEGGRKNGPKYGGELHEVQNLLDQTDLRLMIDHLDSFPHIDRDWKEGADQLAHKAGQEGPCWKNHRAGKKIEAIRTSVDGGVSDEEDNRAGCFLYVAEGINSETDLT